MKSGWVIAQFVAHSVGACSRSRGVSKTGETEIGAAGGYREIPSVPQERRKHYRVT